MDYISQFIDPQYALLVAILYCVGSVLKRTEKVNCHWIPAVLTVLGIILAALSVFGGGGYGSVASGLYHAAGQGILCAGMSVYVNQMIKQARSGK